MLFIHNLDPFLDGAAKERVVSIPFDKADFTVNSKPISNKLKDMKNELSHFLPSVLCNRKLYLDNWHSYYESADKELEELGVSSPRIREIHALMLAFSNLICEQFELDYSNTAFIADLAKQKEVSSQETPDNMSNRVWDIIWGRLQFGCTDESYFRLIDNTLYINLTEMLKHEDLADFKWERKDIGKDIVKHPSFIKTGTGTKLNKITRSCHSFKAVKIWGEDFLNKLKEENEYKDVTLT
ncbi:MAG: hypothetical protein COB02_18020 [Candidatus Cloacimonadota bacterium]|nr:MAG: hypothetical protein COB02_18020 [Candidatus Cloacimonadota bacterium]